MILACLGRPAVITRSLQVGGRRAGVGEKEKFEDEGYYSAGFEDRGRHEPRRAGGL